MSAPGGFDPVRAARVLDRVATLVAAGASPGRAWALVGDPEVGAGASTRTPRGGGRVRASGGARGAAAEDDVRVVLAVAEHTGAPVAPTLRSLAEALRRTAAGERAVRVALAGPRTSANVVLALPVLGIVLASLWGVDTVGVLVDSAIGWSSLTAAGILVGAGRAWSRRLVRAVEPDGRIPGLLLDVWAVALSGGGSWSGAGDVVRAAAGDRATDAEERTRLGETLSLARHAGVPAAALLRSAAEDLRDDVAAASLAEAERLGVRLVVPLGVCVLPAFVLVGVVPVVVALLSSTVTGLG